jgi:hypothetical protein
VAVANSGDNNVSVFLGDGGGGFNAAVNFPVGENPQNVRAADFHGDGKLDLVTVNTTSNDVSLLLGNGAGSFAAPISFAVGSNPVAVTVADLNLDGKPDIMVPNYYDGNVSVLLNSSASCPPTNKEQCKKAGWQTFKTPRAFKNQGDCIQFVNTGK